MVALLDEEILDEVAAVRSVGVAVTDPQTVDSAAAPMSVNGLLTRR